MLFTWVINRINQSRCSIQPFSLDMHVLHNYVPDWFAEDVYSDNYTFDLFKKAVITLIVVQLLRDEQKIR